MRPNPALQFINLKTGKVVKGPLSKRRRGDQRPRVHPVRGETVLARGGAGPPGDHPPKPPAPGGAARPSGPFPGPRPGGGSPPPRDPRRRAAPPRKTGSTRSGPFGPENPAAASCPARPVYVKPPRPRR